MKIRERVAPLVSLLTSKVVIISIVAAIAMVIGAMSVGSLIRHKAPAASSGQAQTPDPTHGGKSQHTSQGIVAGAETGQVSATNGNTAPLAANQPKSSPAASGAASPAQSSPGVLRSPIPLLPGSVNPILTPPALPEKPPLSAEPVPLLQPVQALTTPIVHTLSDPDVDLHLGLHLNL